MWRVETARLVPRDWSHRTSPARQSCAAPRPSLQRDYFRPTFTSRPSRTRLSRAAHQHCRHCPPPTTRLPTRCVFSRRRSTPSAPLLRLPPAAIRACSRSRTRRHHTCKLKDMRKYTQQPATDHRKRRATGHLNQKRTCRVSPRTKSVQLGSAARDCVLPERTWRAG